MQKQTIKVKGRKRWITARVDAAPGINLRRLVAPVGSLAAGLEFTPRSGGTDNRAFGRVDYQEIRLTNGREVRIEWHR